MGVLPSILKLSDQILSSTEGKDTNMFEKYNHNTYNK